MVNEGNTVVVTRQVHFNAAHRLNNPRMSAQWNRRVFGACNSPNYHGHNYVLEVSIAGVPDRQTGFVVDLSELKEIVTREIVDSCDHKNLNLDVPYLRKVIPSVENLSIAFWGRIEKALRPQLQAGTRLYRLRLYETPRNWADYYGPQPKLPGVQQR